MSSLTDKEKEDIDHINKVISKVTNTGENLKHTIEFGDLDEESIALNKWVGLFIGSGIPHVDD